MEKTKIENILLRYKIGHKTLDESTNEILLLCSVGRSEQLDEHKCSFMINADWTYSKCECGKINILKVN